jgi:hypothetical protein
MFYLAQFFALMILALSPKFTQPPDTFIQTQLDAVFIINADTNTTTALYTIAYIQTPSAPEIRWLFPIPPHATQVSLAPNITHTLLDQQTEAQIEPPVNPICQLTPIETYGHGFNPQVVFFDPIDAELLHFETPESAWDWFDSEAIPMAESAQNYEHFAGVRIIPQQDNPVGVPQNHYWGGYGLNTSATLRVDYAGTEPFLPVGFHAQNLAIYQNNYDKPNHLNLNVYIIADHAYTAQNWHALSIDLSDLRDGPQVDSIMQDFDGTGTFFNTLDYIYYNRLLQDLSTMNGQVFSTEYVGNVPPSAESMREQTESREFFDQITAGYSTLTRLRSFISPDAAIPDPTFAPLTIAPQRFRYRLQNFVDPAVYYGCTTRVLHDPDLESRLPEGRTYIPDLQIHLAHPQGWVLSAISETLFALAPEPLTYEALNALENGQSGPPVLLLEAFTLEPDQTPASTFYRDNTADAFTQDHPVESSANSQRAVRVFYPATAPTDILDAWRLPPARGVRAMLITSRADDAENEALYQDMLSYIATRQFWLSPELRHTVFVGEGETLVQVGYPEDWTEHFSQDHKTEGLLRPIAPDPAQPHIKLMQILPAYDLETLQADYALEDLTFWQNPQTEYRDFETPTRRGYLIHNGVYLIEASVNAEHFDTYAPQLETLIQTVVFAPQPED